MNLRAFAVFLVLAGAAAPASAQQAVSLQFNNGMVTLRAQNAPIRSILTEWARLGGATIVNGDRVAGPPVTLELTNVSERQALDIILRSVAGYMLAPRAPGSTAASTFDRILILPTSTAPRPAAPTAPFAAQRPPVQQPQVVRPLPEPPGVVNPDLPQDDPEDDLDAADPPAVRRPPTRVITPVRPGQPPQPLGPEPQIIDPDAEDQDQPSDDAPAQGTAPTRTNPFGVPFGSTNRPGMVTPVPEQQQPQGRQRP